MVKDYCHCCGNEYEWGWEEAFDKFGFMDGDGNVNTGTVEEVLNQAGYETAVTHWSLHNLVITSIKKDGREILPVDNEKYVVGYDEPRDYLPSEIIELLDREVK